MARLLGAGTNVASVYARGGTRYLFTLPGVASIEWGRALDGVSKATVKCTPAKAEEQGVAWTGPDCAGLLSLVQPWGHELVIHRDGERVWEGPIRRPLQNRAGVTIAATDVLGWADRRVTPGRAAAGVQALDEAEVIMAALYSGSDLNVDTYIQVLGTATGALLDLDVKARSGYYGQTLATLASAGLYFTVVGRSIVLWSDPAVVVGRTGILDPALHIVGDVETAREGDSLATGVWAVNDSGEVGADGATDAFYGVVERLLSLPGVVGAPALTAAALAWRRFHYPAPESLTLPAGSTLHCDAPFPIDLLVPGTLTPVEVHDLCWPVAQTMMLTEVKVTQDSGGERVAVTYAPIVAEDG